MYGGGAVFCIQKKSSGKSNSLGIKFYQTVLGKSKIISKSCQIVNDSNLIARMITEKS